MPMNLGMGLGLGFSHGVGKTPDPLCDAIARKMCLAAVDDDQTLMLAPHVVYKRGRREFMTLDAVLLARDGKPVKKPSLRTYRVDDLTAVNVTDNHFTVLESFEADDPEYAGRTICVVQSV